MARTRQEMNGSRNGGRGRGRHGRNRKVNFPTPYNYRNTSYLRLIADVRDVTGIDTLNLAPRFNSFLEQKPEYNRFYVKSLRLAYKAVSDMLEEGKYHIILSFF